MAPYPSDFFVVDGRVQLEGAAMLADALNGGTLDPFVAHRPDGFPKHPQIVAYVPGDLDETQLAFHDAPEPTLSPATSPTVLLDATTGEPVLHFAELDPGAGADQRRALLLRPLTRLVDGRRYVVALRDLRRPDGQEIEPPEGFRRLRDGEEPGHAALEPMAARFEGDVFAVLEDAGVVREELVLAWDFTVSSEEDATRDMLAIRADLMTRLAAEAPAVSIEEYVEAPSDHVALIVRGTLTVPLYMDRDEPGARLLRDDAGELMLPTGSASVPFSVTVPPSVAARGSDGPPARLIQYGHGFFGTTEEGESDWLGVTLDALYAVAVSVDFQGMSQEDFSAILDDATENPARAFFFNERLHQGMANQIAAAHAAQSSLVDALAEDERTAGLYDPSSIDYYGNSNGHILGSTYVTLSPHIDRAIFGVGGISYSFMMFRAQPFASFVGLFQLYLPDRLDVQVFTSMVQSALDRIDPIAYAPHMLNDTYEGSPASRRVLLHYGPGDHAVPYLATELHARVLGIPLLGPATRNVPAVTTTTGPIDGSALVQFPFDIAEPLPGTYANPPTDETEPHEAIRRLPEAIAQMQAFLEDGVVAPL